MMKEHQPIYDVQKHGLLEAEGDVCHCKQRRMSGVPFEQVVQASVQLLHDQYWEAGGG